MAGINAWIAGNNPNAPMKIGGETLQGLPAIIQHFSEHTLPKESKASFCLLLSKQISTTPALANPIKLLIDQLFANQDEAIDAFKAALSQNDVEGAKVFYQRLNPESRKQILQYVQNINLNHTDVIFYLANEVLGDEKSEFYKMLEDRWVRDNPPNGQKALNQIRKCRSKRNSDTSLFFYQLKLRTMPPFILRDLSHLTKLDITENELANFTVLPGAFPALTALYLRGNKLQTFTAQPGAFPALQELTLRQTELQTFTAQPGVFPKLTKLVLSYNKLSTFTAQLGVFPALTQLDLSSNELETFNGVFPALTQLDLSTNKLSTFTAQPGAFPALQELNLYRNKLQTFTAQPGAFPALEKLKLTENELATFTAQPGAFPALNNLNLNENELSTFTAQPGDFPALRELHLRGNKFQTFTAQPGAFPALNNLDLYGNKLQTFTAHPGDFPALSYLFLTNNKLSTFTADTGTFPELNYLDLDQNKLQTFTAQPQAFPNIITLDLNNNPQLRELPLSLQSCINFQNIYVDPPLQEQADLFLVNRERVRAKHAEAILPEMIKLWSAYSGKEGDFSYVKNLNKPKKRLLNEWLHRLEAAAEFRNNQKGLASIVCDILASLNPKAINYSAPFVESFYAQLLPNLERCGDRAGETLNIAYAAWVMHHLPANATDKEKLELLVKAAKAFALNKAIANKLAGKTNQEENVEVHLFYKTLFKEEIITAVQSSSYADSMGNIKLPVEELRETMNTNCWSELTDLDTFKNLLFNNQEFMEDYNAYLEALGVAESQEGKRPTKKRKLDLLKELEGLNLDEKTLAIQKQLMIQHAKQILSS